MQKSIKEFFKYVRRKKNIKDTVGPLSSENGPPTNVTEEMVSLLNKYFDSAFTVENKVSAE